MRNRSASRVGRLLAVALLAAVLCACGGRGFAPAPGRPAGGPGAGPGSGPRQTVFPVIMRPQEQVEFPDKAVSWQSPATVLKLLPSSHTASCDGSGWLLTGGMYQDALPLANLTREGTESELGRYAPDWQPGDPAGDLAYGIYHWNLRGYTGAPTMKFAWDPAGTPSDFANMYVGFANYSTDAWDWYAGPADMVLTVPSFGPYRDAGGVMLLAVVMLGSQAVVLSTLEAGAPETRGTGADELPNPGIADFPVLGISGSLPASVDLADGCAPIGDQGNWGSCTAWASGDGAYNYELGMIYGTLGWDLTKPKFQVSPDYIYVKSGMLGGYPPGGDYGRWTNEVIDMLLTNGAASLLHVPYDLIYDPGFSPNGPEAAADAQVLRINKWQTVECSTLDGINNVKAILALQRKVLPMQIYLDYSFFDYQAGQVWTPQSDWTAGGHAMCIVGYDDGKQAFKVRNSWGAYWGEDGYVWIGYEAFELPFTGALAFTLSDEYDPAVAARFGLQTGGWTPVVGLEATDGTTVGGVSVSWDAHPNADGYKVYRDSQTNLVQTLASAGSTSWKDDIAADGRGHIYWVQPTSGTSSGPLSAPDTGFSSHAPQLLSVSPTQGTEGQEAVFTVAGFGSGPLTYAWDFGGGANPNTSTEARPTVVLANAGLHQGSVTVSSPLGSDTLDFELGVGGIPPVINFIEGRSGFDGSQVTLKPDISGSVNSYSWNFGGGANPDTSSAAQPSVTLGAPGLYEASLSVISGAGADTYNFFLSVLDSGATDWPVFGHDGRGSGQSPVTGPQTNNLKWKYFAGLTGEYARTTRARDILTLPDGDIIVNSEYGYREGASLRRLNPDGTFVWNKVHMYEAWYFASPMLNAAKSELIVQENADIVSYDVADGSELWRTPNMGLLPIPETEGGKLIATPDGKSICTLDASNGSLIHGPILLSNTDSTNYYGTAVLAPNGTLFIPSRISPDWTLISFDTTNDVPSDRIWIPQQLAGMALSADGTTLFTVSGPVRAYDVPTCQQLWWTQPIAGGSAPRVMADGTVVTCSQPGGVTALHPETGEILWSYDRATPQDSYSTPAIGRDGTVYVGGGNKKFYAIRDGALVWESADATTWDFNCSPSIGPDGTAYGGDNNGWVWAFGPGSGGILEPPMVDSVAPTVGTTQVATQFSAQLLGDPNPDYSWDFGGGATPDTSTEASPTVQLSAPGIYFASLTVSNPYGDHRFGFVLRVYNPGGNEAPVADIVPDKTSGSTPLLVTFDASSSTDLEGPIVKYEWDPLGDGSFGFDTGSNSSFQYTFAQVGTYDPAVRVTDYDGATDTAQDSISVNGDKQWYITPAATVGEFGAVSGLLDVSGKPGIVFGCYSPYAVHFVLANDADGSTWGSDVDTLAGGSPGAKLSASLVGGNPAAVYLDYSTNDVYFIRATSPSGAAWNQAVKIGTSGFSSDAMQQTSLVIANGRPAASFYSWDLEKLCYCRSNDAVGASWPASPMNPDPNGYNGKGATMIIATGKPLIAYLNETASGMYVVRANDSSGSAWGAPIAFPGGGGAYANLTLVDGLPAVTFTGGAGVMYAHASDSDGLVWGMPNLVGQYYSGHPLDAGSDVLVGCFDNGNPPRMLVRRSTDASGASWFGDEVLQANKIGSAGLSMAMIGGRPCVSFYNGTDKDLMFAIYR